jgi:hypothetical protein
MVLENRFRWDNTKMVKTSIVLPLETVRKLEYSLLVSGGISTFKAMTSIEAKPLMNKIQLSSEWNSVNGLNGNIRLETPFEQVPYSQITLSILVIALNVDIPPLTRREYSNFLTVSNGSTIDVLTILVLSHLNLFSTAITSFLPYWIDADVVSSPSFA